MMKKSDCVSSSISDDDSDCNSILSLEDEDEEDDNEIFSIDDGVADLDKKSKSNCPAIFWSGGSKKTPIFLFKADALGCSFAEHKSVAQKYHLSFKQSKGDCKLVRTLLTCHGFREADPNNINYNIVWTGSHVKPHFLSSMLSFQKVNHFPRSYEITRKDRLYKNIEYMQQCKGFKHFNFVPQTFVLPREYKAFSFHSFKEKCLWIVKPTALSRGRGIFLTNSPERVLVEDNVVVCRYIDNPFLINGYKFDLRLYVAVTSFEPLVAYLYQEGLTRFATVPFDKSSKFIGNSCMHLTNYSINKHSSSYVGNKDPSVEDRGSKWSLSGLLRFLKENDYDTTALMTSIEDIIIKTLIAGEYCISAACRTFIPHRGNCFELFGFDILVDENLKPWVLEVNLSPSLACDSPLDLKIKSNMIADLLSLIGVECQDPMMRRIPNAARNGFAGKYQKCMWWRKRLTYFQKRRMISDSSCSSINLNNNNNNIKNDGGRQHTSMVRINNNNNSNNNNNNSRSSKDKVRNLTSATIDLNSNNNNNNNNNSNNTNGICDGKNIANNNNTNNNNTSNNNNAMTNDEAKLLRRVKEEYARRGGWVRIFPTEDTWAVYQGLFQVIKSSNVFLHQHLFSNEYCGESRGTNDSMMQKRNEQRCLAYESKLSNIKRSSQGNNNNNNNNNQKNNNNNHKNNNNNISNNNNNEDFKYVRITNGSGSVSCYDKLIDPVVNGPPTKNDNPNNFIGNSLDLEQSINRITCYPGAKNKLYKGNQLQQQRQRHKVLKELKKVMTIVDYLKYLIESQVATFSPRQERRIFSEYLGRCFKNSCLMLRLDSANNGLNNNNNSNNNGIKKHSTIDYFNFNEKLASVYKLAEKISEYYNYKELWCKLTSELSANGHSIDMKEFIDKFIDAFNKDTTNMTRSNDDDGDNDCDDDDDDRKKLSSSTTSPSSVLFMEEFFDDADVEKCISKASLSDLKDILCLHIKQHKKLEQCFNDVLQHPQFNPSFRSLSAKLHPRIKGVESAKTRQTTSNTDVSKHHIHFSPLLSSPLSLVATSPSFLAPSSNSPTFRHLPLSSSSYKQALLVYGGGNSNQVIRNRRVLTSINYLDNSSKFDDTLTGTNLKLKSKNRAYSANHVLACRSANYTDQSQASVQQREDSKKKITDKKRRKEEFLCGNSEELVNTKVTWSSSLPSSHVISNDQMKKRHHRSNHNNNKGNYDDNDDIDDNDGVDDNDSGSGSDDDVDIIDEDTGRKLTKNAAVKSKKDGNRRINENTNIQDKPRYNKDVYFYKHNDDRIKKKSYKDKEDLEDENSSTAKLKQNGVYTDDRDDNDEVDDDDYDFDDDEDDEAKKTQDSSFEWKETIKRSKELLKRSNHKQRELVELTTKLKSSSSLEKVGRCKGIISNNR